LLKTPVPTLIFLGWGAIAFVYCLIRYRQRKTCLLALDAAALLVPAAGFFAIALTTDINLGYRHILPALPFAIVFSAGSISKVEIKKIANWPIIPASLLAVWLIIVTLLIYPDYLSYFNFLAGGPQNGWRSLVDSNLDWGQDLDDLPGWMIENNVDEVWLSYFGEARPEYYGISYQGLDSFPPRLMNPQTRPFFPTDPAPGIYAISATNLQGVHFTNHEQFSWFREQEPLDKLGHSIFLYQVPVRGEPVSLLLSGVQIDELLPQDFRSFGSNDVRPRWIDLSQSLVIPTDSPTWLLTNSGTTPHQAIAPYLEGMVVVEDNSPEYQLARYDVPELPEDILAEFNLDDGRVRMLETTSSIESKTDLIVTTIWEQVGKPRPLMIFIHVYGSDGQIVAQWDGLGAAWEGWRTGDGLIQVHEISLPEGLPSGTYQLVAGVYEPDTGRRWLSEQGLDYIELELLEQ